jgi:TM2 domain-containing membrane protein YozV
MKDKNSAGLLAFFLGGIGVHRFYLKQTGLGFLYLLFFWSFIPAIVAIIDAIIFWTMDINKFNEKYNKGQMPVVNVADELHKLNELKEKGVLTEEEFLKRKSTLLN